MSRAQPRPQPHQKLWVVRYGTMSRMVWAGSAEYAERKVRTGRVHTLATEYEVESAPVLLKGEMLVRMATDEDVAEWHECGGKAIEWVA